ncbi:MAG: hypothetical protein IS632_07785 [Thaumarchaeota archaeon]|nr:hypothetical protein [Nitrososphaerota archaeon]
MNTIAALACVAVSALFAPAYAHTLDSVGEYRLELQWAVEPPYSGEVNTLKLYVSPLVPGLELAEQPFQNGVEGLEDTIKIQLANRDYMITLLPEADDWIPGLYNAHVKVLRPGFYQANILGQIEETVVSLSMHPHEVRDAGHITFPGDYGEIRDILVAQEALRAEQEVLGAGVEAARSASADLEAAVRDLEARVDALAGEQPDQGMAYLAMALGAAGIVLGGMGVHAARRRP